MTVECFLSTLIFSNGIRMTWLKRNFTVFVLFLSTTNFAVFGQSTPYSGNFDSEYGSRNAGFYDDREHSSSLSSGVIGALVALGVVFIGLPVSGAMLKAIVEGAAFSAQQKGIRKVHDILKADQAVAMMKKMKLAKRSRKQYTRYFFELGNELQEKIYQMAKKQEAFDNKYPELAQRIEAHFLHNFFKGASAKADVSIGVTLGEAKTYVKNLKNAQPDVKLPDTFEAYLAWVRKGSDEGSLVHLSNVLDSEKAFAPGVYLETLEELNKLKQKVAKILDERNLHDVTLLHAPQEKRAKMIANAFEDINEKVFTNKGFVAFETLLDDFPFTTSGIPPKPLDQKSDMGLLTTIFETSSGIF